MAARPKAADAGEPGPKTRLRRHGLFGVDQPTPSVRPHTAPTGTPVTVCERTSSLGSREVSPS